MELVQGRLPDDELLTAEEHMSVCADCRLVVAEAAGEASDTTGPTRPVGLPPEVYDPAGPSLAPGTRVSRYQIQELIGVGAIGAVYAARDPELHRMVALKVLRTGGSSHAPAGDLRARLLREARAMAQLSHPNVVTVHDAGTYQDGVFLTMELVAGTTLRRWLGGAARSVDQIVRAFRAAGEGLAAAHRSGLVHRDFKPENVLVGDDGRVRVTDFGLARPTSWELTGPHRAIGSGDSWVHTVITRTGIVSGTPAYMAPEQFSGEPPDPRCDQFSFCVALYEAIYNERPFGGATLDDMVDAVVHGRLAGPPAGVPVPAALQAALLRGLRVRPEERHASMDALLGELAESADAGAATGRRRPRRGVLIAAAGGLTAGAVAIAAVLMGGARDEPPADPAATHAIEVAAPPASEAPAPPIPAATTPAPIETAPPPAALPPARADSAPPAADDATPPAVETRQESPRRARARPAPRRADDADARAEPDRKAAPERKAEPARVGDGLRDPFGGAGAP